MKGYNRLDFKPYLPLIESCKKDYPYICRIVPYIDSFEFEWFDNSNENEHSVYYRKLGVLTWEKESVNERNHKVAGLDMYCDYEFYIENQDGLQSNVRIVRTGDVPGTVINYLHPNDNQYKFSGKYLCSPSIAKLPSGNILASMDLYAGDAPQNLTLLFISEDGGENWRYLTDLYPMFWGTLFVHKNKVYMLGMTTEYGHLHIACSDNEGKDWSAPVILFRGSCNKCSHGGFHRAPTPICKHNGRIWTSAEFGSWFSGGHYPSVLSIDEDDDLMVAENWSLAEFLRTEGEWLKDIKEGHKNQDIFIRGEAIEGNVVAAPDGTLYNLMRYMPKSALCLKIDADNPEKVPEFAGVKNFEMAHAKFFISRHDNGIYYAVGNRLPERNIVSLYKSTDLEEWVFVKDILNFENEDKDKIGFQYPSFVFDGDELLLVLRTAFNNADSFHDANYQLFFRVNLE